MLPLRVWQAIRRYFLDKPVMLAKPGPEAWLLLTGVFFTFTLVGIVTSLTFVQVTPDAAWMVTSALLGGCYSVGWAAAFMFRKWWLLALTMLVQFVLVPRFLWPWLMDQGWVRMYRVIDEAGEVSRSGVRTATDVQSLGLVLALAWLALGQLFIMLFVRRMAERTIRDRAELAMAQRLHTTLVPPVDMRHAAALVAGRSLPSSELGGDLLDVLAREDAVDVVVADVSGHGVKAGVGMAMVKGAIRMRLANAHDLGAMATDLNAMLARTLEPGMFVTMAALRTRAGQAQLVMAGHVPVLWWRAREARIERIDSDALPLAVDASEQIAARSIALAPGDMLLVTTDGLMETADASGAQLGLHALERVLRETAPQGPRAAVDAIFAAAQRHGPGRDDRTVVAIACP